MKTLERRPAEVQTEQEARVNYKTPAANIRETKDGYMLESEMPGVTKGGLEVTVENNELTIIGHRSDPDLVGDYVHRESRKWDYRRVFELDPTIDTGRITARIDNGVLTLTLPKTEAVKPRKITVS